MQVEKVYNQNFTALIKINKPEELVAKLNKSYNQQPNSIKASLGTSSIGLGTGISTGVPITNTAATGSDVIGSAFCAKAIGIDSFGIAPSVIAKITPYATPQTIASSVAHPETAGGIFSTIGGWFHRHAKISINSQKKIPS